MDLFPSLPFSFSPPSVPPTPLPNQLGSLRSSVSKRICNILSREHAFGDNRTISMYDSRLCLSHWSVQHNSIVHYYIQLIYNNVKQTASVNIVLLEHLYCTKESNKLRTQMNVIGNGQRRQSVWKSGCSASPVILSSHFPFPPFFSLPFPKGPPRKPARGLGERCKLTQWGLRQSRSRQTIWCISGPKGAALVAIIFLWIFERINEIFCTNTTANTVFWWILQRQ